MIDAMLVEEDVPVEAKGPDFAVTTKFITTQDNPPAEIVWITGKEGIFYVEVAGVNQIITLRSEMKAEISKKFKGII